MSAPRHHVVWEEVPVRNAARYLVKLGMNDPIPVWGVPVTEALKQLNDRLAEHLVDWRANIVGVRDANAGVYEVELRDEFGAVRNVGVICYDREGTARNDRLSC